MTWTGKPARTRTRPDLCAEHDHPGCTYNARMNKTWCLCGERIYDGDQHTHASCCGGPLEEVIDDAPEPDEGDEQWIPHDGLPEWMQDGWDR